MTAATAVTLIDVSARDGLQDEHVFVPTARKREIVAALAAAGVPQIEATSFVHPRWVPQLADAEALVGDLPHGPRYSALVMNVRGFARAVAAFDGGGFAPGSYDLVYVTSASPRHAAANNNRTIDETLAIFDDVAAAARAAGVTLRAALSCSFVSPWPDERIDDDGVVRIVRRLEAGGVRTVTLADTVGRADPFTVAARVRAVRDAVAGVALSLHLHDSFGYALANVYAALAEGVRTFEGALAGLGGCPFAPGAPGNLDLQRLAAFLADCGMTTGIDPGALAAAAETTRSAVAAGELLPTA